MVFMVMMVHHSPGRYTLSGGRSSTPPTGRPERLRPAGSGPRPPAATHTHTHTAASWRRGMFQTCQRRNVTGTGFYHHMTQRKRQLHNTRVSKTEKGRSNIFGSFPQSLIFSSGLFPRPLLLWVYYILPRIPAEATGMSSLTVNWTCHASR